MNMGKLQKIEKHSKQVMESKHKLKPRNNSFKQKQPDIRTSLVETLGDVVEESESDPEKVQTDSSIYDTLLSSLKSSCGSFAHVYDKRQREQQGVSSEEEEESEPEVGSDDMSDAEVTDVEMETKEASEMEIAEAEEAEDVNYANDESGSDEECDTEVDEEEKVNNDASMNISSFKSHMEYILSEADVQKLKEGKRKFKSELTAYGMPMCKWKTTNDAFPKDDDKLASYGVKMSLQSWWQTIFKRAECCNFTSAMQSQFFSLCNSYQDILHSNKNAFMAGGQDDDLSVTDAYLLHLLNHVYKTRDIVTKNNARLSQQSNNGDKLINAAEPPRDQGFTRPKVLILVPLRSIALRTVKRLIELIPNSCKESIEYKDRFIDEFGAGEDDENGDLEDIAISEGQKQGKYKASSKPADFQALFGGNNDDHFRFGIKFTKKTVKLYSDFYSSDIIVASPIGLITRIGEAETEKNKDVDFLSSIEILVIDNADVILMQNWSHIVSVVDQLNQLPTKQHGTDFMRIREWYLNGQARYYRQTIILSNFANADINALFNRFCVNYQGKVKLLSVYNGVLPKVLLQVRQVYERFYSNSVLDVDDKRFEFFTKKIFPKIKDSLQGGIMLFISSYFDFVRLRNFLKEQNASFCLLGEYTKQSDISRGRTWFFHGERKIILYTERAHFYHRYKIRGIRDLIYYSLPERNDFYAEITNMFEGVDNPTCTVLFSHFDILQLERIVGTSSAQKMLKSKKRTFIFC
ncbi:hypothetical protein SUGI_0454570 [Cryptomeria japonica]|uniref:protein NUCLEOLAR FACTOR 1-like isoform X2 n=1 Tax=Cryptomeria japonica TaxID=3369 RepID=UPI002408D395|nr:protein NUCLEOLAR FACTOR 1-like isoform X2 [Cryptomeria japonica]XP_059077105.1 protein NUCLEOLAR FACTOR 1-like isoform X2 [Cryptomeria japonica]GLJ23922.1 hypothetical protein SUGI_0454570 [Cryptomeria japonica]